MAGELEKPDLKEKYCNKCEETFDISEFSFLKTKNAYDSSCKTCNKIREKKRRVEFKDEINARRKEIRKPLTAYQKLKTILRNRLISIVKSYNKSDKYLPLVGCNRKFFREWYEYHFELEPEKGMTWDNHGSVWHNEHVVACYHFDLEDEDEKEQCFLWKNLKPELIENNLSKGEKRDHDDEEAQRQKVNDFLKIMDGKKNKNKKSKVQIRS